jgi:hypothetical protein
MGWGGPQLNFVSLLCFADCQTCVIFAVIFLPKSSYKTAMPPKKQISSEEKLQIRCWAEAGISTAEIAKRLGRHIRSIQKVIVALKKVPANMPPPPPVKRPGRPKLVSYRMIERLRLFITRNPSEQHEK